MQNVTVIDRPLVIAKLTRLRCKDTDSLDFRRLLGEISLLMAYEVARSFETKPLYCPTPLGIGKGVSLKRDVVLAPILRAGLGMMQSILQIMPDARIGFLGLKRNEQTLEPDQYYTNLPADLSKSEVILIDPMLATGGSVTGAMAILRKHRACHVKLLCLVTAPLKLNRQKESMSARKPVVVIDEWDGDRCGGGGFRSAKTKLKQQ